MANSIWLYRLFDVAEEINLEQAEKILAHTRSTSRVKLSRLPDRSIHFSNPPVLFNMGRVQVSLGTRILQGSIFGKLYDLGVVSLVLKLEVPEVGYDPLKEIAFFLEVKEDKSHYNNLDTGIRFKVAERSLPAADASSDSKSKALITEDKFEETFTEYLESVCQIINPALVKPRNHYFVEDFTLFYFTDWNAEWDALPLLLGEKGPFSPQLREDTLRYSLTYGPDDLTIITWDAALVYDRTGSPDIPDLLEFAVCQLLELRYYDYLLNKEMAKMYDAIKETQQKTSYRRYGQYRRITKQLMELVVDINEITERIQNSLKVTGDIFYARVFRAALDAFRSKVWMESVERKVTLIQQNYSLLNNEIVNERGALLEIAIIFLIGLEIILGLLQLL